MKFVQIGGAGHYSYAFPTAQKYELELAGASFPDPDDQGQKVLAGLAKRGFSPQVFDDPIRMLDELRPDIAVINSVMADNARYTTEALARGISVFSEKPLATSFADLEALEAAYRAARAKYPRIMLTGMFGIDYTPPFETAYRYVQSGALGDILLANGQKSYRMGNRASFYSDRARYGGTIPWVAIHAIEWIIRIGGLRPITASACAGTAHNAGNGTMESTALMLFSCDGGRMASVSADVLRPEAAPSHGDDRLRLVGSKGILEVRGGCVTVIDSEGERELPLVSSETELFEEFLFEITGQGICRVRTEDAFLATRAALAAREAADTAKIVSLQ